MPLKAVLFDLDGVLIDTESIYTRFWSDIDRRYPTGVDNFALKIKGSTLPSILDRYFDKSVHADIIGLLKADEDSMTYRAFEGVEQLLTSLRRGGIATAIVTSSNRPKMDVVFAQLPFLSRLTDTLVTDEDVTASKPDPQGYLLAAARLGADPAECVVVEDSLAGLRAGLNAGARVAGITTTNPEAIVAPLAHITAPTAGHLTLPALQSLF